MYNNHIIQHGKTTFKRVWWVTVCWAAAEAVVGMKYIYEGCASQRQHVVNSEHRDGMKRKTSGAKETNGDEREDVHITPRQMVWESWRLSI